MTPQEIASDLQRRYEGTFVFIEFPDQDMSLFHIDRVRYDADRLAKIQARSPDYGQLVINHGSGYTLHFKFPRTGVFQHGTEAMVFCKHPDRQYKRGLCTGNSRFRAVDGQRSFNHSHSLVMAAFERKTFTYAEGLEMLKAGRYTSVAIGNNFSLVRASSSAGELRWWDRLVGRIAADGTMNVLVEAMRNEINEVVKV